MKTVNKALGPRYIAWNEIDDYVRVDKDLEGGSCGDFQNTVLVFAWTYREKP